MPLRCRHSIGSPMQNDLNQEQISSKTDYQNETPMTVNSHLRLLPQSTKQL